MSTDREDPVHPQRPATPASPTTPDGDGLHPSTDPHPSTGVPTGTAPRAVLRPVPEGFPTPPPRPARLHRRSALPAPEPPPTRRRPGILLAVAGAAALVLVLGIAGGVLAVRALIDDPRTARAPHSTTATERAPNASAPTDPGSSAPSDPSRGAAGSGEGTVLGDVTVRVVSTEVGEESVGDASAPMSPRGQYVTVVLEITNDSDQVLVLGQRRQVQLETSHQGLHHPDPGASAALDASTAPDTEIPAGGTGQIHAVFDIPADVEPVMLHFHLTGDGGAGPIPWSG